MEKLIRDGQVAIILHKAYGSGWYTENAGYTFLLFDKDLALLVENKAFEEIPALVEKKFALFCPGEDFELLSLLGTNDLALSWIPEGKRFILDNYDGFESYVLEENIKFFEA